MCGIVGIIKKDGQHICEDEFIKFQRMLICAEDRGRQATGVAILMNNGNTHIFKTPGISSIVTPIIPYREGIHAIFGHTRASTGGHPEQNINNHPHETQNWVLIHNGMCNLENKSIKLQTLSQCDTEYFVRMFEYKQDSKKSQLFVGLTLPQIIKDSLEEFSGSWSLAFAHKPSGRIFLTTNGKSPLSACVVDDAIYFASVASYFAKSEIVKENTKIYDPKQYILYEISSDLSIVTHGEYKQIIPEFNRGLHNRLGASQLCWDDEYGYGDIYDTQYGGYSYNKGNKSTTNKDTKAKNNNTSIAIAKVNNNKKNKNPEQISELDINLLSCPAIFSLIDSKLETFGDLSEEDYARLLFYNWSIIREECGGIFLPYVEEIMADGKIKHLEEFPTTVKNKIREKAKKIFCKEILGYTERLTFTMPSEVWQFVTNDKPDVFLSPEFSLSNSLYIVLFGIHITYYVSYIVMDSKLMPRLEPTGEIGLGCNKHYTSRNTFSNPDTDTIYHLCTECNNFLAEYKS